MIEAEKHATRSKPWILLVDDEPRNLQLAGRILSGKGYDVSVSLSGREALKIIKEEVPDLVILDLMMPEMDGFEVCRRIRTRFPSSDVPIIFLTARTDTEGVLESFQVGGVDYITKPFHPDEFLARVKVHVDLQQARKKLGREMAFRERLFTIIAHDLRSPFNSIIGTLDMLKHNSVSLSEEEKEEFISILYSAGHQELMMMDNLLQWARSQFHGVNLEPTQVNLYDIGQMVVQELNHTAEHKGIFLNNSLPPEGLAWGDMTMVQIILRNLVSNAIKFTPRKGTVSINGEFDENEYRCFVRDSGRGVKNPETLFKSESFDSTPGTELEKGTGLGLHLCRDFVHANNGRLWLESSSPEGSVFAFSLPCPPDT